MDLEIWCESLLFICDRYLSYCQSAYSWICVAPLLKTVMRHSSRDRSVCAVHGSEIFFFFMKNVGLKFININALIRRKTNITFRLSNQIKQKKRLFLSSTDLLCLRSKAWLFLELVQHHYPSILSVLQLFHFEPHCEIPATEVSVCCVAPFDWWFQVIYGANLHLGGLEICMFSSDLHLAFQTHFSTQVEQCFILLGCALKSLQCNHNSTIWST